MYATYDSFSAWTPPGGQNGSTVVARPTTVKNFRARLFSAERQLSDNREIPFATRFSILVGWAAGADTVAPPKSCI